MRICIAEKRSIEGVVTLKYVRIMAYIIRQIDRIYPGLSARISVELLFHPLGSSSVMSKSEKTFWEGGQSIQFPSGCCGRIFGLGGDKCIWVLHGWASRGSKLKKLITSCVEKGYEVVAWDGPAHGDSPGRRSSLAPYTSILVDDINSFNKKPYAIIGHSFGGSAAAYACKLGVEPKFLILISAASSTIGVFERYWDFLGIGAKARNKFLAIVERETGVEVDSMSAVNFISTLPQKILVIHDDRDVLVPLSDATKLKSIRSDVEIFITHGLGHNRLLESEKVFSCIFNFLKKRNDIIIKE